MTKPSFVYVTYIATTPDKVWQALVDIELMKQYWTGTGAKDIARVNVSDWKVGSKWEHVRADGSEIVDVRGTVVEFTPPRRMVITWARPKEAEDESKHSLVTFDIEPQGDALVRLTVTHADLEKDPSMLNGISNGWPSVLSNLKTLLETGRTLPRAAAAA
ncbi:MAG: SRPBCC family protein [Vicinamibacteria bacterium]